MNKRIKELMIKSGAYDHYEVNEGVNGDELPMVKFAELIIRECLDQVQDQYLPVKEDENMMKDPKWIGYVHCGVDCMVAIREHFGVE